MSTLRPIVRIISLASAFFVSGSAVFIMTFVPEYLMERERSSSRMLLMLISGSFGALAGYVSGFASFWGCLLCVILIAIGLDPVGLLEFIDSLEPGNPHRASQKPVDEGKACGVCDDTYSHKTASCSDSVDKANEVIEEWVRRNPDGTVIAMRRKCS